LVLSADTTTRAPFVASNAGYMFTFTVFTFYPIDPQQHTSQADVSPETLTAFQMHLKIPCLEEETAQREYFTGVRGTSRS
jgi:hypothetical protein